VDLGPRRRRKKKKKKEEDEDEEGGPLSSLLPDKSCLLCGVFSAYFPR